MSKLTMATLINGRYVETHEVSDGEAKLWKTLAGKDLHKLAAEGPEYRPQDASPTEVAEIKAVEAQARADREREALVRALHAVEKATRLLPASANEVAAFLFTRRIKGNDTSTGNPLAVYYKNVIKDALSGPSSPAFSAADITVYAESSGLVIETPRFQLCIDPHGASWPFLEGHRLGRYTELWTF